MVQATQEETLYFDLPAYGGKDGRDIKEKLWSPCAFVPRVFTGNSRVTSKCVHHPWFFMQIMETPEGDWVAENGEFMSF
jgi:hypothetical protein